MSPRKRNLLPSMEPWVTHIHKHSNSEGAHGLFTRLVPSQANWSDSLLLLHRRREEKIHSDAGQNHQLKSMTSIQKSFQRRDGAPARRSRPLSRVWLLWLSGYSRQPRRFFVTNAINRISLQSTVVVWKRGMVVKVKSEVVHKTHQVLHHKKGSIVSVSIIEMWPLTVLLQCRKDHLAEGISPLASWLKRMPCSSRDWGSKPARVFCALPPKV